jgi:antitoxin MazE
MFLMIIMEANIIKIGNSKGLILSKSILEEYNIHNKIEVILEDGRIILKPIKNTRENWESSFKQMRIENDDQLLIDDIFREEKI